MDFPLYETFFFLLCSFCSVFFTTALKNFLYFCMFSVLPTINFGVYLFWYFQVGILCASWICMNVFLSLVKFFYDLVKFDLELYSIIYAYYLFMFLTYVCIFIYIWAKIDLFYKIYSHYHFPPPIPHRSFYLIHTNPHLFSLSLNRK